MGLVNMLAAGMSRGLCDRHEIRAGPGLVALVPLKNRHQNETLLFFTVFITVLFNLNFKKSNKYNDLSQLLDSLHRSISSYHSVS